MYIKIYLMTLSLFLVCSENTLASSEKSVQWGGDVKEAPPESTPTKIGRTVEQINVDRDAEKVAKHEADIEKTRQRIVSLSRQINFILEPRMREVDGQIELSQDTELDRVPGYRDELERKIKYLEELGVKDQELPKVLTYPETLSNLEKYERGNIAAEPFYEDDDATDEM